MWSMRIGTENTKRLQRSSRLSSVGQVVAGQRTRQSFEKGARQRRNLCQSDKVLPVPKLRQISLRSPVAARTQCRRICLSPQSFPFAPSQDARHLAQANRIPDDFRKGTGAIRSYVYFTTLKGATAAILTARANRCPARMEHGLGGSGGKPGNGLNGSEVQ